MDKLLLLLLFILAKEDDSSLKLHLIKSKNSI